jgi:putative ABC transport system substrate-binding protein
MRELGYVEGENVAIEFRGTTSTEALERLAAELVALKVDVIVTGGGTPVALAATRATGTIPIVFLNVGDPVGAGLIASLSHPGGNATGLTGPSVGMVGKRLEFLRELDPGIARVDLVWSFANPSVSMDRAEIYASAGKLGLTLREHDVQSPAALEDAFTAIAAQRPDALLVSGDPIFLGNRQRVVELVAASRLPAMYHVREMVDAGGLMAYGVNQRAVWRRGAEFTDQILKGARPAELPAEQPRVFDFVLNKKTADALGLTIPQVVLMQVTELLQ